MPGTSDASAVVDPFSTTAFLPLVAGLDRLVERLIVSLVKQYPLIFGPWRERFDAEAAVFSKLSRAVADIIHRSPRTAFRKKSRRAIKALYKSQAAAASPLAGLLQTTAGELIAKRLLAEDTENARMGMVGSIEYSDILSRALEQIYKTTSRTLRYKGFHSTSLVRGSGETVGCELALLECPDDSPVTQNIHDDMLLDLGPDARVPVELWFDEDTETVGGSQADSDLFYDDNAGLVNNIDIWVSDKAEFPTCTPLEDSDDIWSSQSTMLDDPVLDWADDPSVIASRASYTPEPEMLVPDIRQRHDASWDSAASDEDDRDNEWPDDFAHSVDQTNFNFYEPVAPSRLPAAFHLSGSMSLDVEIAHHLYPSTRSSGSGSSTSSHPPSQDQAFRMPFDEALASEETTSYFPLLIDDDLEPYEVDGPRSSLPAHTQPTLLPLSAGAEHDVPYDVPYARVI